MAIFIHFLIFKKYNLKNFINVEKNRPLYRILLIKLNFSTFGEKKIFEFFFMGRGKKFEKWYSIKLQWRGVLQKYEISKFSIKIANFVQKLPYFPLK